MRPEIDDHFIDDHLNILRLGQTFAMKQLEKMRAEENPDADEFLELMEGYSICCGMIVELVKEGYAREGMEPTLR